MGLERRSILTLPSAIIEPQKCIVEDLEVLSFENEDQMKFYSIWHETLVDKRRELNAANERERRIIRNENDRKTRQLIRWERQDAAPDEKQSASKKPASKHTKTGAPPKTNLKKSSTTNGNTACSRNSSSNNNNKNRISSIKTTTTSGSSSSTTNTTTPANTKPSSPTKRKSNEKPKSKIPPPPPAPAHAAPINRLPDGHSDDDSSSPSASTSPIPRLSPQSDPKLKASLRNALLRVSANQNQPKKVERSSNAEPAVNHQRQGSGRLPNGLTILNSSHFNTMPSGKTLMKYKLTKLYNKYRGRQVRRNFVNEKQRNARIDLEISKSYLNSWLAYTALQALRLPESNQHSLTTATSGKILTPLPQLQSQQLQQQSQSQPTPETNSNSKTGPKSAGKSAKKQQQAQSSSQPTLQYKSSAPLTSTPQKPPMHLVYIDPGNIITYSNRINPQQVAEYKRKSHLLPSSATSKKSSAASYDVYEIMEVLANSNKTHVTITRNANRPSQAGTNASIYSHSVNASTPGIVSTQLHLQAKSYLDIMNKFYAEEFSRLEKEKEEMAREPSDEDIIRKYLKLDHSYEPRQQAKTVNNSSESLGTDNHSYQNEAEPIMDSEDLLESFEEDIKCMLENNCTNPN